MAAYNLLLTHKKAGKSVFELAFPKAITYLAKDFQSCLNGTFKWDEIEVASIQERAEFVKNFNSIIDDPKNKLILINTLPLEEIFPLKFIDLLTDNPDYTFGQPIYNNSLNFYSYLLDFFCKFYLEKDLQTIDKIEAEDIQTYSPLARIKVRAKNRQNQFILDKYFNKTFNLHKFAIKLVDKFVPGATWRWIGGNHKAHIYCIKICKILIEYGFLDETECEEVKNALYLKIQIYKSLETTLDKDSKTTNIAASWFKTWADGMQQIREYYSEILIHYLYMKQDNEIQATMKKIYQECGYNQATITKEKLDGVINFNKSILFEQEFGRKMMDFLLGYVLSQNSINKQVLTSRKIEAVADNFLHIFSNVDDPYLQSLRLIKEEDYISFVKEELNLVKPDEVLVKELSVFTLNLKKMITAFNRGKYFNNETAVLDELNVLFDKMNEKLEFMQAIQNKSQKECLKQKALFNSNIPLILLNFVSNLANYHANELRKIDKTSYFLRKFSNFMQFYLNDNIDHHSVLYMEFNFWTFENMLYIFPAEISDLLYESLSKNSLILLVKEYILDVLQSCFKKYYDITLITPTTENYSVLSKIIDVMSFYISFKLEKISEWLPEYDIRISMELISESYKEMLVAEDYEPMLKAFKNDKNNLNDSKLMCYMNFLSLISSSSAFRYVDSSYKLMNEKFPMVKLANLVAKCENNLEFRTIFMDLYSNFHVDFKNHLLNNRSNYYFTKPVDMQYEEDAFYDKEYEKTIDLIIRELNYMIDFFKMQDKVNFDETTFINYVNSTLFGTLIKLINYFLVIKEGDLQKLSKYIPKLEELKDFLFANSEGILFMYGIDIDQISSPERKKHELEMANIDPDSKIKLVKKKIIGTCKIILETCANIVSHKPLVNNKKKLISAKTSVDRTVNTTTKIQSFSNKLATRRENINLPFEKAQKKIEKTGGKIEVTTFLVAHYERNKMVKTSIESEKNVYIYLLKDAKNPEMMIFAYNLCSFIHNQLTQEWHIDKKNAKFTMLESLINTLFISTKAIQSNLYKVIQENGDVMLNKIWSEMKWTLSFVRFKTNIDKYWKEAFKRCMILIKFHQYLCEDDNVEFKELMRNKILSDDTIDRVQRWTTIFQKMSDNCNWHYNYAKGEINDFERSHRPYLFPLVRAVFDNLAELCTGPCLENQKKIYTFIYDRYNGFLKRYWRDPNTEYYKAKLSLIEFITCMAEGNDADILIYQTTNLELNNLFIIIIDSLRQLFYCIARNDPFDKKKMSEYPLVMTNYDEIQSAFQMNLTFSKHTLLEICLKLFSYIRTLADIKSKYEIFCNEREEMLRLYDKTGKISNPSIKEDDLVTYKFLSRILMKIEIVRTEEDKLIPFYFPISSKCYYLSADSKKSFLNNVDRSSLESKLSGLYSEKNFFNKELIFNQERFNNRVKVYKYFGSGNYLFFEIFALTLAYLINFSLALGDVSWIPILGYIEIFVSIIIICIFSWFSYPLIRQLKRLRFMETNVGTSEEVWFHIRIIIDIFDSFLLQKYVWVFLYHIFCVMLGFYYSHVFFTFDLLSTINLFDTMQFILRSVTLHIGQLLSTLFLSALIMFSFAMLVFLYFYDNISSTECSNFTNCYFYIMEQAFTNGQGLAGVLISLTNATTADFYGLFFLNIMFFILINTILLNIVLAILVDTFSALRQKAEFFEADSSTYCFICGIAKFNFEKSGIDFETHIEKDHNVWTYVNFLIFMSEKSEKDCNGVEAEIYDKIKTGSLDWFPKGRSLKLGFFLNYIFLIFFRKNSGV